MRRAVVATLVAGAATALAAVDMPIAEPGGAEAAPAPPSGWASTGRLGVFTSNIATANADTSRDPEVRSSAPSASFMGTFDGTLWWRSEGADEVEQRLQIRYGRSRTGDADWVETSDFIEYDGVYRHRYQPRRAIYGSLTGTSAFTGPEPWEDPFDPIQAAAATGHSWLQENLMPLSDRLEVRAGVRAQKSWGKGLEDFSREVEIGPEAFLRYERKQTAEISWWVQAELFTEFTDVEHAQGLGTAGLTLQLTRLISVDLRLRAYYEHHPSDLPARAPEVGYDELGLRQETLIGLSVSW